MHRRQMVVGRLGFLKRRGWVLFCHECVFHALQWAQRLVKEVYGNDYTETHPEATALKKQIYQVFNAKTGKTAHKRYRQVMALKEEYVAHKPEAQRLFAFLERHYPKLVNAVENPLIPLTNNTVELVIRRANILRGQLLGWPPQTLRELVPNA